MTIESLAQDLESAYEGEGVAVIEFDAYVCEYSIEGDSENMLYISYDNDNKELSREIKLKRKPYAWEIAKQCQQTW